MRHPAPPPARALAALSRDLRHFGRSFRRAPGLAGTLLLMLALGSGLAIPLLSLVEAGASHPGPVKSPIGLAFPLRDAGVVSASWEPEEHEPPGRLFGSPPSVSTGGTSPIGTQQGEGLRVLLWTLGAAAALALLIACTELALLLLSRGAARRHEIAMRTALGATPWRLRGQLLAEGATLATVGLLLGVALGLGGIAMLRASWPEGLAPWLGRGPGAWAAALALVPLFLCSLVFAVAPARAASGGRLLSRLSGGARVGSGPGAGVARDRLSVLATSTSVALIAGAVLLLRGFGATQAAAGPGFDPRDTLALETAAPAGLLGDERLRAAYYEQMLAEVRKVPGVRSASLASQGAWMGLGTVGLASSVTGNPSRPGILRETRYLSVSPGYFEALGIPLLAGREFSSADRTDAPAVAVVSQNFAYRFFPRLDPVGKLVQPGSLSFRGRWYTVVGVVADVRPPGPGSSSEPEQALYLSALQLPPEAAGIAVRVAGPPLDAAPAVERAIRRAGPGPGIVRVGTMEEYLDRFRDPLRWYGRVLGVLAAFSVLLAASGLYAVIAHSVARRTREIGIRAAIGARPRALVAMIVRQGMALSARGVAVGLAGAVCLGRLLQFFFHGVNPLDPVTLGGSAALLAAVALAASALPARAAARVEPSVALRAE